MPEPGCIIKKFITFANCFQASLAQLVEQIIRND